MKLEEIILLDTRANQPAATAVPVGTLFCVSDEGDIIERSNGATWDAYSPGAGGSGTVTNTGTLTADAIILGNGTVDVKPLASLGTTTTVLHGNAAGAPSFGAVSLTADVTGTLPVGNLPASVKTRTVTFAVGDGTNVITTGQKGYLNGTPFAGTITRVSMIGKEASGSIVIDVWKTTSGNVPVDGNSITSATPPTITTAQQSTDSTLTSWTTSVAVGDVWGWNVDSVTTFTQVTLVITVAVS